MNTKVKDITVLQIMFTGNKGEEKNIRSCKFSDPTRNVWQLPQPEKQTR
jgi:hypothetical protein